MTGTVDTARRTRVTILTLGVLLTLGALAAPASAEERRDDHRGDRHFQDRHEDRRYHGYYPAPPVVYNAPYYNPPPVVYAPGIGIHLPGISIGIP